MSRKSCIFLYASILVLNTPQDIRPHVCDSHIHPPWTLSRKSPLTRFLAQLSSFFLSRADIFMVWKLGLLALWENSDSNPSLKTLGEHEPSSCFLVADNPDRGVSKVIRTRLDYKILPWRLWRFALNFWRARCNKHRETDKKHAETPAVVLGCFHGVGIGN